MNNNDDHNINDLIKIGELLKQKYYRDGDTVDECIESSEEYESWVSSTRKFIETKRNENASLVDEFIKISTKMNRQNDTVDSHIRMINLLNKFL